MSLISKDYTFSAGQVIVASEHNSNFDTIYNDYNGNITNANLSNSAAVAYSKLNLSNSITNSDINSAAAIVYSKLNLTGTIVNADVSASAAIVDTKLAQITTASKVHGTSITGLASLPSGAGVIPVANLGTSPTATTFLRGDGAFASAGRFKLVSNTSVSAASSTGDVAIDATKYYMIVGFFNSATSNCTYNLIFNAVTTSYSYVYRGFDTAATASNGNSSSATSISLGGEASTTNSQFYFNFNIFPTSSNTWIKGSSWGRFTAGDNSTYFDFFGVRGAITPTTFRISASAGNFSGNVIVYELETT